MTSLRFFMLAAAGAVDRPAGASMTEDGIIYGVIIGEPLLAHRRYGFLNLWEERGGVQVGLSSRKFDWASFSVRRCGFGRCFGSRLHDERLGERLRSLLSVVSLLWSVRVPRVGVQSAGRELREGPQLCVLLSRDYSVVECAEVCLELAGLRQAHRRVFEDQVEAAHLHFIARESA